VALEGIAGQLREGRDSMKFVEMIKSNIQIKNILQQKFTCK